MTYSEKLKDPRWQRKRLEIMQRDKFTCRCCGAVDRTLHVHHYEYKNNPWDVEMDSLVTLCEICHADIENVKKLADAVTCDGLSSALMQAMYWQCRTSGLPSKFFRSENSTLMICFNGSEHDGLTDISNRLRLAAERKRDET